jgi:predicted esterase
VPASYRPDQPAPLLVAFHGAGGVPAHSITLLGSSAEERGFLLLAPQSRRETWDAVQDRYGPDIPVLDGLLAFVFDHCAVDRDRIGIEGFSDGASYAIGVGRANGDLFKRIIGFSPGLVPVPDTDDHGDPEVFISHGRNDGVLSFDRTANETVPGLRSAGYDVTFVEFDGGHGVTEEVRSQAMTWFLR